MNRSLPGRKGEEDHSKLELAQTNVWVTTEYTVQTKTPLKKGTIDYYAGKTGISWDCPW